MGPIPWSLFNMNMGEEEGQEIKKRQHNKSSNCVEYVGLKILMQLSQAKTNHVVKPSLKLKKPTFQMNRIDPSSCYSCFLKSCHLCKNNLSLDKDVYMYRGDLGFCSVECRNRQIYLDDMKELEASTKKKQASFRHCRPRNRCEARAILEQFEQRHKLTS